MCGGVTRAQISILWQTVTKLNRCVVVLEIVHFLDGMLPCGS